MKADEKDKILQQLIEEISIITGKSADEIDPAENLRSNGIDSMGFLEVSIFIKREWQIDFLNDSSMYMSINDLNALAEEIRKRCK